MIYSALHNGSRHAGLSIFEFIRETGEEPPDPVLILKRIAEVESPMDMGNYSKNGHSDHSVLVVNDLADQLELMNSALRKAGYRVFPLKMARRESRRQDGCTRI